MDVADKDIGWGFLFAPEPGEFDEEDLNDALDFVFKYNVRRLQKREARGLPRIRILECGLKYIPEKKIGGIEKQWWPLYWILRRGGCDCKAAACAYAAECVVYDAAYARPFGTLIDDGPNLKRFHARVRLGSGIIVDPSASLEGRTL